MGEYIKEFLGRAADIATLDSFERELEAPIPVIRTGTAVPLGWIREILPIEYNTDMSVPHQDFLMSTLLNAVRATAPQKGTEEVMASFALNITHETWSTILAEGDITYDSDRNSTDASGATAKGLRPDYCLWMQGALIFKSEHKADASGMTEALNELSSKMTGWNPVALRGLPFLPAFALARHSLQFVALYPDNGGIVRMRTVLRCWDLSIVWHRFSVLRAAMNMARVFVALRRLLPREVIPLYQSILRAGGEMIFYDDHVVKVTTYAAPPQLYDLLGRGCPASSIPNTIHVSNTKTRPDGTIQLELRPVCRPHAHPSTEMELKKAIRSVLIALNYLHAQGFVHRDVRWENVLQTVDGTWILADFELAAKVGEPAGMIKSQYLPPECVVDPTRGFEPSGDIYRVGDLIFSWRKCDMILSREAQELAERLRRPLPHRPTAKDLLAESNWLIY